MSVDRCVCHNVPFTRLIRLHRETGARLEDLQQQTGCGTGCGLCIPYIQLAIKTGRAELPVMSLDALSDLREDLSGS